MRRTGGWTKKASARHEHRLRVDLLILPYTRLVVCNLLSPCPGDCDLIVEMWVDSNEGRVVARYSTVQGK